MANFKLEQQAIEVGFGAPRLDLLDNPFIKASVRPAQRLKVGRRQLFAQLDGQMNQIWVDFVLAGCNHSKQARSSVIICKLGEEKVALFVQQYLQELILIVVMYSKLH